MLWILVIHCCLSVEAAQLDLVLYIFQQVEAELDRIRNHPDYTKVLSVDVSEGKTAVEPQNSLAARVFEDAISLGTKVTEKKPHQSPQLNKFGNRADEIYGLANQEQLSRMMEHVHLNGGYELLPVQNRCSCMFTVIRRGVDVPREIPNLPPGEADYDVNFTECSVLFPSPYVVHYGKLRTCCTVFQRICRKGERWDSDSTRDSRLEIARPLQSVFLSAACSNPEHLGRRDHLNPCINDVADWYNCGIC